MNRIKQLREEIGMTQVRLSIELEVSQETISAYEHDKHYPSITSLIKMMSIFDVGIDYIMGFSDIRCPIKDMSDKEQIVINSFRKLSAKNQDLGFSYIQGLLDGQGN